MRGEVFNITEDHRSEKGGETSAGGTQLREEVAVEKLSDQLLSDNKYATLSSIQDLELSELQENNLMEKIEEPPEMLKSRSKEKSSRRRRAVVVPFSVQTRGMVEKGLEPK